MKDIMQEALESVITGTAGAGRISLVQLNAIAAKAMRRVYTDSEIVKVTLAPIDEVKGEEEYVIPSVPHDGKICRLVRVYRRDAVTGKRVVVRAGTYSMGYLIPSNDDPSSDTIILSTPSAKSAPDSSLELVVVAAYETDDYVPSVVEDYVRDALIHMMERILCLQTGKPWTSPSKAKECMLAYNRAIARARTTISRGGTNAGIQMRVTGTFL